MKIRELLSGPERWCQGTSALDAAGGIVDTESDYAVRWCLVGALSRCYSYQFQEIRDRISLAIGGRSLAEFNDNGTFEAVRELVTRLDV